jgi:hypothetical protein
MISTKDLQTGLLVTVLLNCIQTYNCKKMYKISCIDLLDNIGDDKYTKGGKGVTSSSVLMPWPSTGP